MFLSSRSALARAASSSPNGRILHVQCAKRPLPRPWRHLGRVRHRRLVQHHARFERLCRFRQNYGRRSRIELEMVCGRRVRLVIPLRQKTIGGLSVAKASNRAADFHPEFSCSFHSTGVHSVSWLEHLRSRAACRDTPSNTPLNQDRWRFRQCSKSKYLEQAAQQCLSDTLE